MRACRICGRALTNLSDVVCSSCAGEDAAQRHSLDAARLRKESDELVFNAKAALLIAAREGRAKSSNAEADVAELRRYVELLNQQRETVKLRGWVIVPGWIESSRRSRTRAQIAALSEDQREALAALDDMRETAAALRARVAQLESERAAAARPPLTGEIWLTQEAYDRLREELADRAGPRREHIVKRIEAAREEGDLLENGGYHAAKEEQGKNEARVKMLRHMLENARIGAPPAAEGEVAQGQVVTVRLVEFDEEETFLLGSREEAATASISVYSPTSPLGSAVLGAKIGDTVSYDTYAGKTFHVEVLKSERYTG